MPRGYSTDRAASLSPLWTAQPQPKLKVALPDEYHFPYEFKLPVGLPPSVTLNPGFVYYGRPIGISYEVRLALARLINCRVFFFGRPAHGRRGSHAFTTA